MIKQVIANRIDAILNSPHTSIAAFVTVVCGVGIIWIPAYSKEFAATLTFAQAYGLTMAGDAKAKPDPSK